MTHQTVPTLGVQLYDPVVNPVIFNESSPRLILSSMRDVCLSVCVSIYLCHHGKHTSWFTVELMIKCLVLRSVHFDKKLVELIFTGLANISFEKLPI